ncbi:MAG: hypothetical protein DME25_21080 [Verrucomicrobia bacterium]|nr:MAG: hypothetical protein DME25_21080 [Verrucomicrobiota bacterium]
MDFTQGGPRSFDSAMRLRAGGSNILDKEVSKRAKERAGLPWADMLLPLRGARSDPWQADAAAVPQLEPARDRPLSPSEGERGIVGGPSGESGFMVTMRTQKGL